MASFERPLEYLKRNLSKYKCSKIFKVFCNTFVNIHLVKFRTSSELEKPLCKFYYLSNFEQLYVFSRWVTTHTISIF